MAEGVGSLSHELLDSLHIVEETAVGTLAVQIMNIMPEAVVTYL